MLPNIPGNKMRCHLVFSIEIGFARQNLILISNQTILNQICLSVSDFQKWQALRFKFYPEFEEQVVFYLNIRKNRKFRLWTKKQRFFTRYICIIEINFCPVMI